MCLSTGSESALAVLESCIKQTTPTTITEGEVGVSSEGVAREERGLWVSELAALLSPAKTPTTAKVSLAVNP